MAEFAELLFGYIDELSAASVAGYNDELNTSGRVRERYRERLGQRLLAGAAQEVLTAAAERAEWTPPASLTAVLLPAAQVHGVLALVGADTLLVTEDLPGADSWDVDQPYALLLVPDVGGGGRRHLLRVLDRRAGRGRSPAAWTDVRASYDRAVRTVALVAVGPETADPVDTEDHLVDLVVGADPEALADLRARVLEPLAELGEATRERLAETLLCWLLHQGRRDEVAAALHVHAQTVRYRMQQVRELYGDRLNDERFVRELVVALPLGGDCAGLDAGTDDGKSTSTLGSRRVAVPIAVRCALPSRSAVDERPGQRLARRRGSRAPSGAGPPARWRAGTGACCRCRVRRNRRQRRRR